MLKFFKKKSNDFDDCVVQKPSCEQEQSCEWDDDNPLVVGKVGEGCGRITAWNNNHKAVLYSKVTFDEVLFLRPKGDSFEIDGSASLDGFASFVDTPKCWDTGKKVLHFTLRNFTVDIATCFSKSKEVCLKYEFGDTIRELKMTLKKKIHSSDIESISKTVGIFILTLMDHGYEPFWPSLIDVDWKKTDKPEKNVPFQLSDIGKVLI